MPTEVPTPKVFIDIGPVPVGCYDAPFLYGNIGEVAYNRPARPPYVPDEPLRLEDTRASIEARTASLLDSPQFLSNKFYMFTGLMDKLTPKRDASAPSIENPDAKDGDIRRVNFGFVPPEGSKQGMASIAVTTVEGRGELTERIIVGLDDQEYYATPHIKITRSGPESSISALTGRPIPAPEILIEETPLRDSVQIDSQGNRTEPDMNTEGRDWCRKILTFYQADQDRTGHQ
jgi:hypothetical protein